MTGSWHLRSKRLLSAYVDQALDRSARAAVHSHLEGCRKCRQALEEIETGSRLAKLARQHNELDELTRARLFHSLNQVSRRKQRKLIPAWAVWSAIGALAVVLVLLRSVDRPWKIPDTTIRQAGSLPLDLFLQEATDRGRRTDAYAFMASSAEELSQHVGRVLPEPDLPSGFSFRRGFIYQQRYGGAIGRVYGAPGGGIICLLDQPVKAMVRYGERNPERCLFCGRYCRQLRWPSLRLLTWEAGTRRTLLLTNLGEDQLEQAFVHYPSLH